MDKDRQAKISNVIDIRYDCYFTWRSRTFSADSSPVCCRVVDPPFSEQMNSLVPSAEKKEWTRPGLHWFTEDSVFCLWGLGSRIYVHVP